MSNSKTTENHFDERIWGSDVNEEIDVYEDHIRYENFCPWCREDYYDFEYRIEWDKLFVKCINFTKNDYWENYDEIEYKFIENWNYNKDVMIKYFNDNKQFEKDRWDVKWKFEYKNIVIKLLKRFEFKPLWLFCYTNEAKRWIMKQIINKNFKK